MKYFSLFFFYFFCSSMAHAQFTVNVYWTEQSGMNSKDLIYYSPGKNLEWKDFKGEPVTTGPVAALTSSGFGYKADMKNKGDKGQINIAVYSFFSKSKSWVKPGNTTPYILNHEQHHFDVSFIAAGIFIEKLKKMQITPENCNIILPALYRECCDMMNKMQNDYDGQTRNGLIADMQEKWNQYFAQKLPYIIK